MEKLVAAVSEVQFPAMRTRVISALASLADRAYQQRVWVDHVFPDPDYYDDLDEQVHALFDDTKVCTDPEGWVDVVLHPGEVEALRELGVLFEAVIDDLGDVPDSDYLADPRWDDVIRLARVALAAMTGRDPDEVVAELG